MSFETGSHLDFDNGNEGVAEHVLSRKFLRRVQRFDTNNSIEGVRELIVEILAMNPGIEVDELFRQVSTGNGAGKSHVSADVDSEKLKKGWCGIGRSRRR